MTGPRRNVRTRTAGDRSEPYPWMSRARCGGIHGFTEMPIEQQKPYCGECSVTAECALLALTTITYVNDARDVGAVWGGMTPPELARAVRQKQRASRHLRSA